MAEEEELKGDLLIGAALKTDHKVKLEEAKVDMITKDLFQEYMLQAKVNKTVQSGTRNMLMNNLHWNFQVGIHELTGMFKLKARTVKEIIKQKRILTSAALEYEDNKLSHVIYMGKIKDLIRNEISSKKNLITVKYIQEKIFEQLEVQISYKALHKILKDDLQLEWKRVRHQDLYVNT